MGLDMYIVKRRANADKTEMGEEMCYWRKFNALHKLILDYFHMEDNCDYSPAITQEDVSKWAVVIDSALDAFKQYDYELCRKILPPCAGFFFGSQEIDEWYGDDLKSTKKQFAKLIKEMKKAETEDSGEKITFHYVASW